MANTPVIEVDTAYSVLQPMFEKVVRTIQSCKTADQYYASERYMVNFLNYTNDTVSAEILPGGYTRMILASYYGAELRNIFVNQAKAINVGE
jgi:polygalacturonase